MSYLQGQTKVSCAYDAAGNRIGFGFGWTQKDIKSEKLQKVLSTIKNNMSLSTADYLFPLSNARWNAWVDNNFGDVYTTKGWISYDNFKK